MLRRLRSTVGKLRLLRNATPQYSSSWRLISNLRSSTALLRRRQPYRCLSLTDRRSSGLIDVASDYKPESESSVRRSNSNAASASSGSSPPGGRVLHRTASCPESAGSGGKEGDEDVDRKAEMFIANFYRQMRLEKQVSLELRYWETKNQSILGC